MGGNPTISSVIERHPPRCFGFRHYPEPPQGAGCAVHSQGPPDASSREDFRDDLPVHVGQTAVDAIVAEGQLRVIDAEQMQDRRVLQVKVEALAPTTHHREEQPSLFNES